MVVQKAMVSWFIEWRIDWCTQKSSSKKIGQYLVGSYVEWAIKWSPDIDICSFFFFFFYRPTDCRKIPCEKSAIQGINRLSPWLSIKLPSTIFSGNGSSWMISSGKYFWLLKLLNPTSSMNPTNWFVVPCIGVYLVLTAFPPMQNGSWLAGRSSENNWGISCVWSTIQIRYLLCSYYLRRCPDIRTFQSGSHFSLVARGWNPKQEYVWTFLVVLGSWYP